MLIELYLIIVMIKRTFSSNIKYNKVSILNILVKGIIIKYNKFYLFVFEKLIHSEIIY